MAAGVVVKLVGRSRRFTWTFGEVAFWIEHQVFSCVKDTIVVVDDPGRAEYVERLGENVIVNKTSVNGEEAHQKNDVTSTENNTKHLS